MKKTLHDYPVYLFLLSLFFVFHGYTENFNYIPIKDGLALLFIYLGSSIVIAGAFWLLYRNISKAGLVAFLLMGFYFFFGYFHDVLTSLAPDHFISRHRTLLGGGALIILSVFIYLFFRKKTMQTTNYVIGVFLLLLLLVDFAWLAQKIITHREYKDTAFKQQFTICDTCSKPDVYLIIPDLYAGEQELKEMMNFDNSAFINELNKRGFRYLPKSRSNYNYTPFSVASTLHMDYLQNVKGSNSSHADLSICYDAIRENRVTRIFTGHGYRFYNYSLFDIFKEPSPMTETALPEKTKFITAQTLLNRLGNDARFNMAQFLGNAQKIKRLYTIYNINQQLYNKTISTTDDKTTKPKFVYTHLVMPHNPYYFTKEGKAVPVSELEDKNAFNIERYVEYLQYTNTKLLSLVDTILLNSKKPPIIILMSDHGFREFPNLEAVDSKNFFINLSAVYLPDRNYSSFYDSMSNVNIFRTIFNKEFNQRFPLLKDSTHYINQ